MNKKKSSFIIVVVALIAVSMSVVIGLQKKENKD